MKKKIGVIMMFMVSLMLVGCGGAYPNYGLKGSYVSDTL